MKKDTWEFEKHLYFKYCWTSGKNSRNVWCLAWGCSHHILCLVLCWGSVRWTGCEDWKLLCCLQRKLTWLEWWTMSMPRMEMTSQILAREKGPMSWVYLPKGLVRAIILLTEAVYMYSGEAAVPNYSHSWELTHIHTCKTWRALWKVKPRPDVKMSWMCSYAYTQINR